MTASPHRPTALTGLADGARADLFARRPLTGVRVIDAHAHLGPYSRFFIPDPSTRRMVQVMDRCGVEVACIASHLAIELDAARGNEETAAAVDEARGRLWGLLTLNPHHDPEEEAARWEGDPRFAGIKLHPDLHHYPVTGPRYAPAWQLAAKRGLPVLVHTNATSPYNAAEMLGPVAERHPDVTVLMGHAAGPAFEAAAELARRHDNLYLEVCGTFMTADWLRRLVDTIGPRRVIYGSDAPFIDMRYSLGRVLFADLDDDALRLVFAESLCALLPPLPCDL